MSSNQEYGSPATAMSWKAWVLRVMATQPERICDPRELAEWKRTHTPEFIAEQKQPRGRGSR